MIIGIVIGLILGVPFGYVLYGVITVNKVDEEREEKAEDESKRPD